MRQGTLRDLPGIGASTAEVIEAAVEGRMPARLAKLEREAGGPLVEGGEEVRAALRGDLHSHSDWSDGGSPDRGDGVHRDRARPRLPRAHRPLAPAQGRQRALGGPADPSARGGRGGQRAPGRRRGFRLLKGIEVDILDDGSLDQTEEMLGRLDLRVASVHSKLAMDKAPMTRRMVAAVHNPFANVLGHCTGRLVTGNRGIRKQSEFDAEQVFGACAETGTAVEINSRPERRDPPTKLLQQAIEMGCLFSIDSDAHAPGPARLPVLRLRAGRGARASTPTGS